LCEYSRTKSESFAQISTTVAELQHFSGGLFFISTPCIILFHAHHSLRSRVSRVLIPNGLVYGNPAFSTHPTESTYHQKIVTDDYVHDFYSCAKFGGNPSMGGLCANR